MYRLIIEHIVKQVLKEARLASATTKAKQKLPSSEYKSKFTSLSDPKRIGNVDNITDQEFKSILKNVFKIEDKDIKTIPPGENGLSSKYTAYAFPYEGAEAVLILAGRGKEEKERQERGLIEKELYLQLLLLKEVLIVFLDTYSTFYKIKTLKDKQYRLFIDI